MILKDKTALVTGGSRGIGRAIAIALADEGANVAFTFKSAIEAAEKVKGEIESRGRKALAIQSDAKDINGAQQVVDRVVKELQRIDILVNNAGITKDTLLMRMSEQDWDDVLDTNLKSAFNFSKAVCRPMMSQREGKIINLKVVKGIGFGCDEESIKVMEKMPLWSPGKQRGQTVLVSFTMPIRFILN